MEVSTEIPGNMGETPSNHVTLFRFYFEEYSQKAIVLDSVFT